MKREHRDCAGFSSGTLILALLTGACVGAVAALLIAPDSGIRMRRRLRKGAKIAQEEFADVAAEAKEALGALGKDARQTLRQTATRLGAALGAAKDALKDDSKVLRGVPPHG
ncbi:MAG TPA: YtxH domain-containing protein [Nitrospiraceae bacterium]|nr:YtxH domain-containing protein [Nitrospiraceae bacterium]